MRVGVAPGADHPDRGFSLAEVVIALTIMSIAMAAFAPLMATTIRVANLQTEQQLAAEVAVGTMDTVQRMIPAGLLRGRDKESVDASYDDLPAPGVAPYLADMQRAWDPTAAPGTGSMYYTRIRTETVSVKLNGVWYNRRYFVGRCWQSTPSGPCDISSTTGVEYFRVVVSVTWGNQHCPANTCLYVIATLVSSAPSDPVFNTNLAPTVSPVADRTTAAGALATPITLTYTGGTAPISWSVTGEPPGIKGTSGGNISGTPTAAGTYTVTCRAIDANGKIGTATFTWTVT